MVETHRVNPGMTVNLKEISTSGRDFYNDRDEAEKKFEDLREELIKLQYLMYAENKHRLLIVLQAMDAGGKDSTIRRVFTGVNPQGVHVTSFKAPSKEELAHDFLWRIHDHAPARGMISVFNRSHYEDVLIVRVEDIVPESVWSKRFQQINDFERMLADNGTTILKFYLHISLEEQKERFQDRLDKPHKQWKFSVDDLRKRKQWGDYQEAFEDVLTRCSTEHAPWHIIPADQKWYRNMVITNVIVDTLRDMDMKFPKPEDGLDKIVIE